MIDPSLKSPLELRIEELRDSLRVRAWKDQLHRPEIREMEAATRHLLATAEALKESLDAA